MESINRFFRIIRPCWADRAIALLVAAFGIANTMIMAIYSAPARSGDESHRGTNQDVMSVFLAESGAIGLLAGSGGIAFNRLNAVLKLGQSLIGRLAGAWRRTAAAEIALTIPLMAAALRHRLRDADRVAPASTRHSRRRAEPHPGSSTNEEKFLVRFISV